MIFHLYRETEIEDFGSKELEEHLIPTKKFSALTKSNMIPRANEWSDLIEKDVELHLLKFSSGYASNFPSLNR